MLVKNNFDWEAVAKKFRREIKQVEVTRTGDFIAGLGRIPDLKQAAIALDAGLTAERVFATDSGSVLVRVREKILPPENGFEKEKEALRRQLLGTKQQDTLKSYIQTLKEQYSVKTDLELFETL
jgi:hypothetical protein